MKVLAGSQPPVFAWSCWSNPDAYTQSLHHGGCGGMKVFVCGCVLCDCAGAHVPARMGGCVRMHGCVCDCVYACTGLCVRTHVCVCMCVFDCVFAACAVVGGRLIASAPPSCLVSSKGSHCQCAGASLPSVLFQMHRPFPPTHPGTGVKDPTLSNSTPPLPERRRPLKWILLLALYHACAQGLS